VKPELSCTWITAENVDALLTSSGCPRDVDFFSLDIDGNDYWVWEAVEAINPKVCCIETLDIAPSNKRITMPYDPKFSLGAQPPQLQDFRSGSLAAMVKLSKRKGYRLVGAHRHGFNAFFMRNDIGMDFFPEVSVVDVHNNPWTKYGQSQRWETVKNLGWVEV
jgi:hypothetical protein